MQETTWAVIRYFLLHLYYLIKTSLERIAREFLAVENKTGIFVYHIVTHEDLAGWYKAIYL